jgi:Ca-activated chloride channel homolog
MRPKNRMSSLVLLLLLALCLNSISSLGQDRSEKEVVRVETNFVTVPVSVMDKQGRYIHDLKKNDFSIFENGTQQEIAFFEPSEKPFTVLLLIDVSCSMHGYLPDAGKAADAFIRQLRADDQVIVATYSDDALIHVILGPVKKRDVTTSVTLVQPPKYGFTTTFDAVERGIDYMKGFSGRRAIIFFSDGELYGKHASAKSSLKIAEEQDSLIYPVRFGPFPAFDPGAYLVRRAHENQVTDTSWSSADSGSLVGSKPVYSSVVIPGGVIVRPENKKETAKLLERVNAYMGGLAGASGGRYFQVELMADLEQTFGTIAEELGRQYSLGYLPSTTAKDGESRRIKVRVNAPDTAVRARTEVVYRKRRN